MTDVAVTGADRAGRDAGSLEKATVPAGVHESGMTDEQLDEVEEALRDVVDPELGVNIVDLGLIYDLHLADEKLVIDMTLTSAACPLTEMIEDQINAALTGPDSTTELVKEFTINWVWLPPWGPEKISDDGRDQLRALGFNI
ncbi:MAG: metal-sulfur cluster assembly factor [Nakamurella sp.]